MKSDLIDRRIADLEQELVKLRQRKVAELREELSQLEADINGTRVVKQSKGWAADLVQSSSEPATPRHSYESRGKHQTDEEVLERVIVRVRSRLESLEVDGVLRFDAFHGGDDLLVQHTIVFDVFHRFFGGMDAHIGAQRTAGKSPIRAAFAPAMLAMLAARGFDVHRARRLVGLFFQMARAYFFIAA